MTLTTTTEPAEEPFTADEAKAQMRVTIASEDTLIDDLIKASRQVVETYLRQRLITQTVRLTLNGFPGHIQLPIWPVRSIDNVRYINTSGVSTILASTEYQLITSRKPCEIAPAYLKTWPIPLADYDVVTVDLIVGYGLAGTDIPYDIRQAMMLLIADLFENRENAIIGQTPAEMPFGVKAMLAPHVFWI